MEIKDKVAKNLANIRLKNNISQKDMASMLSEKLNDKISNSSISHWEKGDYTPSVDVMFAYCNIFGITPTELLDYDESNEELKSENDLLKAALVGGNLTEQEFDCLSNEDKKIVLENARTLIKSLKGRSENND